MEYKFDHDWFSPNIYNMEFLFGGYDGTPELNLLEIGSFEGLSTVWMLDNIKNSKITCIDTWMGGVDHDPNNPEINFKTVKENFDNNIECHKDRVRVIQKKSYDGLIDLYQEGAKFDFVFVDGSHTAIDVNADLVMSWPLIKVGGLIYCDDYYWGFTKENVKNVSYLDFTYDSPKLGIDSFVNTYRAKLSPILRCTNNAAVFVKTEE